MSILDANEEKKTSITWKASANMRSSIEKDTEYRKKKWARLT